jgi:uncharacterized protein (UPF0264 family)
LAGLLVSVRSADEARAALRGGASVIDVKDPARGPLGRATPDAWRAVREAVPETVPVSVALGELVEWPDAGLDGLDWTGIVYRKLGLAGAGPGWADRWAAIREGSPGPPWVAVAYADWQAAEAPSPGEVLDVALNVPGCVGLLVDTWDKSRPGGLDDTWSPIVGRARASGRLIALAGRLDAEAIRRLAPLRPDLFAVRGAACVGGDRRATIDAARVADLARIARSSGPPCPAEARPLKASRSPSSRRGAS